MDATNCGLKTFWKKKKISRKSQQAKLEFAAHPETIYKLFTFYLQPYT